MPTRKASRRWERQWCRRHRKACWRVSSSTASAPASSSGSPRRWCGSSPAASGPMRSRWWPLASRRLRPRRATQVPDTACVSEAISLTAAPIRARLGLARGSRWVAPAADPSTHRVALRLQQGIRVAARGRDLDALAGLERALAFVGRGHTAGEALELERLADLPEAEFSRGIRRLPPPGRRWEAIDARLGGLLLFRPG